MKKLFAIMMVCALMFTGCGKSVKDIKVTSFDIVSITPRGLSELAATIELGVNNPIISFTVRDALGTIKLDGTPCLDISADQIIIDADCEKIYSIPLRAKLCQGFNPFSLLTLFQNQDLSRFTVDVGAKIQLRSGVGKTFELKDIPLDKLVSR